MGEAQKNAFSEAASIFGLRPHHFHIIPKHILAMKLFQLDDEVYIHFLGVHLFHQFAGGFHCSTGCQQVVNIMKEIR